MGTAWIVGMAGWVHDTTTSTSMTFSSLPNFAQAAARLMQLRRRYQLAVEVFDGTCRLLEIAEPPKE